MTKRQFLQHNYSAITRPVDGEVSRELIDADYPGEMA